MFLNSICKGVLVNLRTHLVFGTILTKKNCFFVEFFKTVFLKKVLISHESADFDCV